MYKNGKKLSFELDAVRNMHYMRKRYESKLFDVEFHTKKSVGTHVYSPHPPRGTSELERSPS